MYVTSEATNDDYKRAKYLATDPASRLLSRVQGFCKNKLVEAKLTTRNLKADFDFTSGSYRTSMLSTKKLWSIFKKALDKKLPLGSPLSKIYINSSRMGWQFHAGYWHGVSEQVRRRLHDNLVKRGLLLRRYFQYINFLLDKKYGTTAPLGHTGVPRTYYPDPQPTWSLGNNFGWEYNLVSTGAKHLYLLFLDLKSVTKMFQTLNRFEKETEKEIDDLRRQT